MPSRHANPPVRHVIAVLTLAFAVVTFFALQAASADTGFLDRSIRIGNEIFLYQVYIPAEWSRAQNWPVVLYLHGNGGQGTDGLRHTSNSGVGMAIRADRSRFPAVFVFPQARPGTRWTTARMHDMVLAQLDASIKEFNGDLDRVYLTGFSMGGQGVMRIGSRWPDRFAAFVEVAGRLVAQGGNSTAADTAADIQTHPFLSEVDSFIGLAKIIRDKPIRIHHGDADDTVSIEQSRRFYAALKAVGAQRARFTEYPGTNHSPANEKAWADSTLMSWLLAQRRGRWA